MKPIPLSRFVIILAGCALLGGGLKLRQWQPGPAAGSAQFAASTQPRHEAVDDGQPGAAGTLAPVTVEQAMEGVAPQMELPQTAEALWVQTVPEAELAAFQQWSARWTRAGAEEREELMREGVALAEKRRAVLRRMIQRDPAQALARTLPVALRRSLPAEMTALLETRVEGQGTLVVLAANTAAPGESAVSRRVEIGQQKYRAFVYGWREHQSSQRDLPLHGIALDGMMAVSAWPGRVLEQVEKAEALAALTEPPVCPVSKEPAELDGSEVAVRAGAEDRIFCSTAHAEESLRERITRESQRPRPFSAAAVAASGGNGTSVPYTGNDGDPDWTTGAKRLLFVRVNFASHSYHDLTTQHCHDIVEQLGDTMQQWSRGALEILPSDQPGGSLVTPVISLSRSPTGYTADDVVEIWDETWEKLDSELGINRNSTPYHFLMLAAGDVPLLNDDDEAVGWGGIGMVYGYATILRVNGPTAAERIAKNVSVGLHEFGHNIGLQHCGSHFPYLDYEFGSRFEYGDIFDRMGSGEMEFGPAAKRWLQWLPPEALPKVTEPGRFTIRANDETETYGRRGLIIPGDPPLQSNTVLLLDYRTSGSARLARSVGVRTKSLNGSYVYLQDTTPETPMANANGHMDEAGTLDAPLREGRTFSFPWYDVPSIHVTTLETDPEAGTATVQVNYGTFPGNQAPAGSITQSPASAFEGAEVVFTASASDAEGDDLAYQWTTPGGALHRNERVIVHTFSGLGNQAVSCRVSDMKGKSTMLTRSVFVTANPSAPVITGLSDRTTPEDTMIDIPFAVSDAQTAAGSITVTAGIYDPDGVITTAGLQTGSNGGGSRWVRLTPRPNQHGGALVVVEAYDGTYTRSKTFLITVTPTSGGPVPVASGSTWRYWAASGAPPAGWVTPGYADGTWNQGASPFTHGETAASGTTLPAVLGRTATYYRRTFTGPLVFGADTPMLRVRADDGVIVYFNGTEIWRKNMSGGVPGHTTVASRSVEGRDELVWNIIPLPDLNVAAFQTHTIAAEVHDSSARGSGDVRFDLEFQRALGPRMDPLDNRTTLEDTTLTFTVSATDAETPGDTITLSGRSLDQALVSDEDIRFEGGRCFIAPQSNVKGNVTIFIAASDGSTATERSFLLRIVPVNDPPVLEPLADVTSPAQQPVPLIPVRFSDADHPNSAITLTAVSSYQTLVPNSALSFLPDPDPAQTGRRWLRISGLPGSVNDTLITITATDGVTPASRSFTLRSIFQTPVNITPLTIVGKGEAWHFSNASSAPAGWNTAAFNQTSWAAGPAPLGYALGETSTVPALPLRLTSYFRKKFTAPPDPAAYGALTLKLQRDDGAIVYLNGAEIHRSNMPAGLLFPGTTAIIEQTGAEQTAWRSTTLTGVTLLPGENLLAVQVRQASMPVSAITSDLLFNLGLEAEPVVAPLANKYILSPQLSAWRYHDGASPPAETWALPVYPDDTWSAGPAPLGFGTGLANTLVNGGPAGARYPVVCFRRTFDVADPADFHALHLMLQHDDGIRVFLNGTRLLTANVNPDATLGTYAWNEIPPTEHETWRHSLHSADRLVPGSNLLAVELHQYRINGTDLHFDLELIGIAAGDVPELALDRQADGTWLAHWSAVFPGWRIERASGLSSWSDQQPRAILRGARFELPEPDTARHFYRLTR